MLGGFEPPTSFLPSDKIPTSRCGTRVYRRFRPKKNEVRNSFLRMLVFPVRVSAAISSGVGQFATAGEWSYFALLETIKGYQNEDIEPPVESNAPSGWLYSFSVCFL